ncbi:hypothetical protein BC629DRAFT_534520 [Irpex lacteus]|nr:hypothetical protein BC629DRAFT_534520 [Irpex lacteus]
MDSELSVRVGLHPALLISEVQGLIFNGLSVKTCAKLARTCKPFYEQAMNIVWEDIAGLAPLVNCMPSNLLEQSSSGDTGFCRDPTDKDWEMFCKHAHRVRTYTDFIDLDLGSDVIQYVTETLRERDVEGRRDPLFPKLINLSLNVPEHPARFHMYTPHLAGNTLQSFRVEFVLGFLRVMDYSIRGEFRDILPKLWWAWPGLRSIRLPDRFFDATRTQFLGYCISQFETWMSRLQQLELLRGQYPLWPLMKRLSKLPNLRILQTVDSSWTEFDDQEFEKLKAPRFPSLRTLATKIFPPTSPLPLLQTFVGSTTLRMVELYPYELPPDIDNDVQNSLASVYKVLAQIPNLEYLDVWSQLRLPDTDPGPVLSGELLALLHPLRHIQHLHLELFFDISITDQDLGDAAVAWPMLKELQLAAAGYATHGLRGGTTTPRTTMLGIHALYNGCPHLQKATLYVNDTLPVQDGSLFIPPSDPLHELISEPKSFVIHIGAALGGRLELTSSDYMPMLLRVMLPFVTTAAMRIFDILEDYRERGELEEWDRNVRLKWKHYAAMEVEEVRGLLEEKFRELRATDTDL